MNVTLNERITLGDNSTETEVSAFSDDGPVSLWVERDHEGKILKATGYIDKGVDFEWTGTSGVVVPGEEPEDLEELRKRFAIQMEGWEKLEKERDDARVRLATLIGQATECFELLTTQKAEVFSEQVQAQRLYIQQLQDIGPWPIPRDKTDASEEPT